MSRRVRIGDFPDGTTQLQTSMHGYDAMLADHNDINQISFSTRWTNPVRIHSLGAASVSPAGPGGGVNILFPELGYIPFIDVRRAAGNVFYDDRFNDDQLATDIFAYAQSNGISVFAMTGGAGQVLYLVYAVPI